MTSIHFRGGVTSDSRAVADTEKGKEEEEETLVGSGVEEGGRGGTQK